MREYWGSTFPSPKSGGIYTIYNMPSLLGLGKVDPQLHERILGIHWEKWIPRYMIEYWGSTFPSPKCGGIYTIYNMPSLLGLGKVDPQLHERILGIHFSQP